MSQEDALRALLEEIVELRQQQSRMLEVITELRTQQTADAIWCVTQTMCVAPRGLTWPAGSQAD